MKMTGVDDEETRIARGIAKIICDTHSEEEIENNLNSFPLGPIWRLTSFIHRKQKEIGVKII